MDESGPASSPNLLQEEQVESEDDSLVKQSCHDSGIDIRETSVPPVQTIPAKKVKISKNNTTFTSSILYLIYMSFMFSKTLFCCNLCFYLVFSFVLFLFVFLILTDL